MRTRLGAGLAGAAAVTGAVLAPAGPAAAFASWQGLPSGSPPTPDPRAAALLERAAAAGESVAYSGVQLVHGGARAAFVDVAHFPGRGLLLRVREPGHPPGTPVFEGRPDGRAAAEPPAAVDLLERSYDAVLVGRAVVIGRAADVVEVRRADGSTAARLWLDHRSGLTLRRDVLDPSGAAVRTSRFVELTIAATAPPAAAPSGPVVSRTAPSLPVPSPPAGFAPGSAPPLRAAYPARWSPPFGPAAIARLRRAGWPIPAALPHGLVLTSARRTVGDGPPALHLRYTDGLATVSLFTERGSLDASRLGTWQAAEVGGRRVRVRPGLPQQVVWAGPGVVYTMVADAPTLTVAAVVAALPAARPTGGGVFGRLARGLDRMASWLNPLR